MNIYVGNIPYNFTEDDLNDMFSNFGEVTSAKIIIDRETGKSKGFGFVDMEDDEEGQEAIDGLNGRDINGRALKVNEAKPKSEGGGRGGFNRGGGGGGYNRGGGGGNNRGGGGGGGYGRNRY
ncbi:MAG: RNA-binding protein [Bacteroidetes bacterium]|nr:RNA-binding protein [Bacteroidota bacterium]MCB0845938.1 RNA-binding protein [Bacteroidota bacterium]